MSNDLAQRLQSAPVVPLVGEDDPDTAVAVTRALAAGGLTVIEVVMRSDNAQKGMEAILDETEGLLVGAGTVLTLEQAKSVVASGAQFIVCPGLVDSIAEYCLAEDIPIYPGTMTAGEVQRAYGMGLREVKFFPASLAGGVPMLKAYSSVFRDMRFMPTGGVNPGNAGAYLKLPNVIAAGGTWIATPADMAAGDWAGIEARAREAASLKKEG